VLYVNEGDIVTSAGTAAGIDCCLAWVRAQHGAETAARIARMLVVAPHRQGGQAQYIEQPLPQSTDDDKLSDVITWLLAHLDQQHAVDSLAKRSAMSRRSFTRRFRQTTGVSLGQWLLNQRLARAQRLETTNLALESVATDAGFGSAVHLRQQFTRALGVPPSQYRRHFRAHNGQVAVGAK
jgi:transcriptional regulator GlxA family with amidase domain